MHEGTYDPLKLAYFDTTVMCGMRVYGAAMLLCLLVVFVVCIVSDGDACA